MAPKKKTATSAEFAVIETGGKQYEVRVGDTVTIEKLAGDHVVGERVTFEKVLLWDNGSDTTIGTPYINGAKVVGTIEKMGKAKKVNVLKYKQKSRYLKQKGHRQPFAKVKIDSLK